MLQNYIKVGFLLKKPRPGKQFLHRYFRLSSHVLSYAKDESSPILGIIRLKNATIRPLLDDDVRSACVFVLENDSRTVYLRAESDEEMHSWIAEIQQVIRSPVINCEDSFADFAAFHSHFTPKAFKDKQNKFHKVSDLLGSSDEE
ncbi:hypothetical protein RCL1_007980 [Eukaryota sp. TZLM3-RCL]